MESVDLCGRDLAFVASYYCVNTIFCCELMIYTVTSPTFVDNCGAHLGTLEAGLGFLLLKFYPPGFPFSAIFADKTAPARPRTSTYIIIHSTCVFMYLSAFIYIILFFEDAFICTDLYFLRSLPTAGTCGALTTV